MRTVSSYQQQESVLSTNLAHQQPSDQHGLHCASQRKIQPHLLLMEAAADLADSGSADVDCFRSSDGMSESLLLGLCRRPLRFGRALSSDCTDLSFPPSLGSFAAPLCCSMAEPLDCCTGSTTLSALLSAQAGRCIFELVSLCRHPSLSFYQRRTLLAP